MKKQLRDRLDKLLGPGGEVDEDKLVSFIDTYFTPKKKNPKIPDLEDVIKFFNENGYTKSHAEHVYNYYGDADWKDAKGSPVLAWKQKMRGNWFKEEGKMQKVFSWQTLTLDQAKEYRKTHGKGFVSKLEFARPDIYLQLT